MTAPLVLEELAELELESEGVDLQHPKWALFHAERIVALCQQRMGLSECRSCPQAFLCSRWRKADSLRLYQLPPPPPPTSRLA